MAVSSIRSESAVVGSMSTVSSSEVVPPAPPTPDSSGGGVVEFEQQQQQKLRKINTTVSTTGDSNRKVSCITLQMMGGVTSVCMCICVCMIRPSHQPQYQDLLPSHHLYLIINSTSSKSSSNRSRRDLQRQPGRTWSCRRRHRNSSISR